MTSEVCAMNRRAAVLAADSAVTVERWEAGQSEKRYFKGANKIFQLSNHHPIGLMIFDTADLHRMPWETIVKEFRDQLGDKKCGKVADYAREFFDFIQNNKLMFSDDYRNKIFIELVNQGIMRNIQAANEEKQVINAPNPAAVDAARSAELDKIKVDLDAMPLSPLVDQAHIDALETLNDAQLKKDASDIVNILASGSTYDQDKLIKIGIMSVFKSPEDYLPQTGVVIAGFGDEDYFPSYKEYLCSGIVGSKILYSLKEEHSIGPESSGHISTFAQDAMVNTFYLGFSYDVLGIVQRETRGRLTDFANEVAGKIGHAPPLPNLDQEIDNFVQQHTVAWTQAILHRHAAPFRRVIGSLPVDEMANLAETLVMLESLKEKVTKPSESVGGAIDVAVITKAEGFVWIKRKHFFDSKLNPRYFSRQQAQFR